MSPVSKRQQTLAKRKREQAVQEKRTLKREKKQAAAAARAAEAAGLPPPGQVDGEPGDWRSRLAEQAALEREAAERAAGMFDREAEVAEDAGDVAEPQSAEVAEPARVMAESEGDPAESPPSPS
jgi:hypothetical protein